VILKYQATLNFPGFVDIGAIPGVRGFQGLLDENLANRSSAKKFRLKNIIFLTYSNSKGKIGDTARCKENFRC
jgi:hypothetical protein